MIKRKRFISEIAVVFAVFILTVTSCKKEEGAVYEYLVSNEFVVNYTAGNITALINVAASGYPEINDLKQYIAHDIEIYKIVYKTVIDGESINASGLVCVPSDPGEYPVICFQNGTNTVNAYCPTEYPLNPSYQMVEAVASMGNIVVIPDYPGFGESAQITHPYLIAEPTVRSITDMLFAAREFGDGELQDVICKDEYYVIGYSQGGWATLALHKAMELDYNNDFNLAGSVCGAGPYNLTLLFQGMTATTSYPMPVYIGYIVNAYSVYHQFTNPVTDIFKEPYASRLGSLYNGSLSFDQINSQLTTSVSGLFNSAFITGFESDQKYASVRSALLSNSVTAWDTEVPLLLVHGGSDTSVNPVTTENIYTAMIAAGTSAQTCTKEIFPGLDHGDALVPCMVRGLKFILALQGR